MRFSKKIYKSLAVILVFYLLFSFFMIKKFPKVWQDSSMTCMVPYTLVTKGKLANPILMLQKGGIDQHFLAPHIVHAIILAGIYKIFGFGLVQSRGLSIFAGFFLILLIYYFAKKYHDKTIALFAIIILVFDNVFFVTTRTIRVDILLAFFTTAGFLLFIHGLKARYLRSFALSGIFMGLSFYTHPNSILVLIAILLIFLYEYRLSIFLSKEFWIFSLFCVLAFAPYALYVIEEDMVNNFAHFRAQLGENTDFLSRNFWQDYLAEYKRYANYIYFPKRIMIFLIQICALVYATISKRRFDKYLVFMILIFLFFLPLWNPGNRTSRYFIVIIPAVSILISKLCIDIIRKAKLNKFKLLEIKKRIGYTIAGVSIILFLFNQIIGDIYILWKHKDNRYSAFIAEIKNTIPDGSKIWGSMAFWIGLHNYPYLTQVLPYENVEKFRPEYAILYDSSIWGKLSATLGRKDETVSIYSKIAEKMENLCHKKGYFIKKILDKYYGDVEIYRIIW